MFIVTGTFDGKMYDEDLMTAEDIVKFFSLPVKINAINHFKVHPDATTIDRASQKPRAQLTWTVPCLVQGMFNNTSYIIRYYNTRTFNESLKAFRYAPRKIQMKSFTTIYGPEHFELAVLACLSPLCQNSPFAGRRLQYYWTDPEVEHAKRVNEERIKIDLRAKILNDPAGLVFQVAKGYSHRTANGIRTIPRTELTSENAARVALIRELDLYPLAVAAAYESSDVKLIGAIFHAIDKGQIYSTSKSGNTKSWKWSDDMGGGLIAETNGESAIHELAEIINSTGNRYGFFDKIHTAQGNKIKETKTSIETQEVMQDPLELVTEAALSGIIAYFPDVSKVFILDEKGRQKGNALRVIKERDNWKREVVEAGAVALRRIKKEMETRLQKI